MGDCADGEVGAPGGGWVADEPKPLMIAASWSCSIDSAIDGDLLTDDADLYLGLCRSESRLDAMDGVRLRSTTGREVAPKSVLISWKGTSGCGALLFADVLPGPFIGACLPRSSADLLRSVFAGSFQNKYQENQMIASGGIQMTIRMTSINCKKRGRLRQ